MLPLIDGAGYKLFNAINVLAYRWCESKINRFEHLTEANHQKFASVFSQKNSVLPWSSIQNSLRQTRFQEYSHSPLQFAWSPSLRDMWNFCIISGENP